MKITEISINELGVFMFIQGRSDKNERALCITYDAAASILNECNRFIFSYHPNTGTSYKIQ